MADENRLPENVLKGAVEGGDFLILVSPTVWTESPLGGIHLLQAACREAGVTTGVLYTNLLYSKLLGESLHRVVAMEDYFMFEERLFVAPAFDLPPLGFNFREYFKPGRPPDHVWPQKAAVPTELFSEVIYPFMETVWEVNWEELEAGTRRWCGWIARQIADAGFRIVGCSTTHGGLAPAVALLKEIKRISPSIITVIGGSLCEAEMAEGIGSLNTGIDYVFSGEGDITFPSVAVDILAGRPPTRDADPGNGSTIIYGEPIRDLDSTPLPDYSEFFRQRHLFFPDDSKKGPGKGMKNITIPYETSRGCWYGRCTFCGLMGKDNVYRRKSPEKALEELKQLTTNSPVSSVFMTDNIIPPEYYKRLFPRLSSQLPSLNLKFEIKANLSLNQVQALSEAGCTMLQPGIESLSSSLLRRMDKGVMVQENISLLRYARSLNLDLKWNLLFGIPGEEAEDYKEMLRLFPLVCHLQPPRMLIPIRLCRFSRYQEDPESFDISNLRPAGIYAEILPGYADLNKLAVVYAGDYPSATLEDRELLETLYNAYKDWRKKWVSYSLLPLGMLLPELHLSRESGESFLLRDTRGIAGRPKTSVINREQARLLSNPRSWDNSPAMQWALDDSLAVKIDSRFIPLVTMGLDLLRKLLL